MLNRMGEKISRICKNRREAYYKDLYETYTTAQEKDPSTEGVGAFMMWNNFFPNFLIGLLAQLRYILTTPLFSGGPSILPEQRDAFWTLGQITQWLNSSPWTSWITWIPRQLPTVFNWISKNLPFLSNVPFVGLGFSALHSTYQFYHAKNKSLATILKFLGDVSGAVLLGVGLGLIKWGTAAMAVYTGPLLIAIATGIVATVGLVKSCHHLYKAWEDPKNWKQHCINAFKEFICTFINAAGMVLTIFGIQAAQQLQAFNIHQFNIQVLYNAGEIYKKTVLLSNLMLAAAGSIAVIVLPPKMYQACKWLGSKIYNTGKIIGNYLFSNPAAERKSREAELKKINDGQQATKDELEIINKEISTHIKDLNEQEGHDNSFITRMLNIDLSKRRENKRVFLIAIRTTSEQYIKGTLSSSTDDDLEQPPAQSALTKIREDEEQFKQSGIYQSFWGKGKTEELAGRMLNALSKQKKAEDDVNAARENTSPVLDHPRTTMTYGQSSDW